jgi:hypothetical protein
MNKKAFCYNQKFGHDFPVAGGNCTQCGINQNELSSKFKKVRKSSYKIPEPEKGMHSEIHALAKEISEEFGEPKKFAMYLGIIKNIGVRKAFAIFAEIKQSSSVETPGKLFVYKSKKDGIETNKRKESGTSQKA